MKKQDASKQDASEWSQKWRCDIDALDAVPCKFVYVGQTTKCPPGCKTPHAQHASASYRLVDGVMKLTCIFGCRAEDWMIVSADDYFGNPYKFDPTKIGLAHADCFKRFFDALPGATKVVVLSGVPGSGKSTLARRLEQESLIVDNTNLSAWEISPYVLAANAFGVPVEVIRVVCNFEVAFARQAHGVPRAGFDRMVDQFLRHDYLPFWNVSHRDGRSDFCLI